MSRRGWVGFGGFILAFAGVARAQDAPEPLSVVYEAPEDCPTAQAFFREVSARTTRARAAQPNERARVMHVAVSRRGEQYSGRLWIDDARGSGTARTIAGTTCAEVVGALALIGALAVDPQASTSSVAPSSSASSDAGGAPSTAVDTVAPVVSSVREAPPAGAPSPPPPPTAAAAATSPRRGRFAVGVQAEVLFVAGAVGSGRLFGDLSFGPREALFAPAIRLAIARSLEAARSASIGGASLRWTLGSVDACPLRVRLAGSLTVRPCAGATAGVLDASGTGIAASTRRSRPWASLSAVSRLVWEPLPQLDLELEAGVSAPLVRESFFFTPSTAVYQPPAAAFLTRMGVGLRFP